MQDPSFVNPCHVHPMHQVPYFAESDSELQNRLFADPEPFEKKLDAVAYINSNCGG